MTEAVVPIRPGAEIVHERSRQLLEHVADQLVDFAGSNNQEPVGIVFAIIGSEGMFRTNWCVDGPWRQEVALAGSLLVNRAVADPD